MKTVLLIAMLAGAATAGTPDAPAARLYYKPGRWVEWPAPAAGRIDAPGTATIVPEGAAAETQYVLPMAEPWAAQAGGTRLEAAAVAEGAWLAAELRRGPPLPAVLRDAALKALPRGSALIPLDDLRRGVPESLDLVIAYDFSESRLQPQEKSALVRFVLSGGAVFFVFASRAIPAASVELWRELFGAQGRAEKEAFGLPRGLLVPADFQSNFDVAMPRLRWQRCGRGLVVAYGLAPGEGAPENAAKTEEISRPGEAEPENAAKTEEIFRNAVRHVAKHRHPLSLGPVEPGAFGLFGPAEWAPETRRRLALLVCAYAAAAVGLFVSFGALLRKRRWAWLAGAACIAAAGAALLAAGGPGASGLALDEATVLIVEPGDLPVAVTIARISRLGRGPALPFRSALPMPPRLLLYSRFSASQKTWVNYRFTPGGATVEPLLDLGQSLCLGSIQRIALGLRSEPAPRREPRPPANGNEAIRFFKERWARDDLDYSFHWQPSPVMLGLFGAASEKQFVQVRRAPTLIVTGVKKAAAAASAPKTVRVAAVQCYSHMGELEYNRKLLDGLITGAAGRGAKIVVLPECAVHGYMDPGRERVWVTKDNATEGCPAVEPVAETVPGESTRYFGSLAKKLGIYLALPLVEKSGERFYNAQVLLDPQGAVAAHHRKTNLWAPGDGTWATEAEEQPRVVDSPYGRLGLMICYEVHVLPQKLAAAKADIVLYSVGWFGPNTEGWYKDIFPRRYVAPNGFHVVVSNWSADTGAPGWPGHGYSCVIDRTGAVLAMARETRGSELVIADLPCRE